MKLTEQQKEALNKDFHDKFGNVWEYEQEQMILNFISESERDLEYSIESLEDNVIRYKGAMLKARKAFEDAKNEQLDANYEMWKKFDEELPHIESKIEVLTNKIKPIAEQAKELNSNLEDIKSYRIDSFLETLEKVERVLQNPEMVRMIETLNRNNLK
jgi:predicted transcriptional regulator